MTQRVIIRNNLKKSGWEITKDKCDSTRAHRRLLAANGKHENKRKIYCTNVHLRIIEILITLMYNLSAVTAAVTGGGGGGVCCSWPCCLCACRLLLWLWFAVGVCVFVARCVRAWCLCWCVVYGLWCVVCGGGVLVGLWLVCGVVGPSPLLAEVPVCYSPPLLAGFRCRWCCAVPRHTCNQILLEHLLSYPDLLDLRHFSTRIFHSTALQRNPETRCKSSFSSDHMLKQASCDMIHRNGTWMPINEIMINH